MTLDGYGPLPTAARLALQRIDNVTFQPFDFAPLFHADEGQVRVFPQRRSGSTILLASLVCSNSLVCVDYTRSSVCLLAVSALPVPLHSPLLKFRGWKDELECDKTTATLLCTLTRASCVPTTVHR